jgi:hypothetical protein
LLLVSAASIAGLFAYYGSDLPSATEIAATLQVLAQTFRITALDAIPPEAIGPSSLPRAKISMPIMATRLPR